LGGIGKWHEKQDLWTGFPGGGRRVRPVDVEDGPSRCAVLSAAPIRATGCSWEGGVRDMRRLFSFKFAAAALQQKDGDPARCSLGPRGVIRVSARQITHRGRGRSPRRTRMRAVIVSCRPPYQDQGRTAVQRRAERSSEPGYGRAPYGTKPTAEAEPLERSRKLRLPCTLRRIRT